MKNISCFILAAFISIGTFAQVQINESDIISKSATVAYEFDYPKNSNSIAGLLTSGKNQTWDFSKIKFQKSDTTNMSYVKYSQRTDSTYKLKEGFSKWAELFEVKNNAYFNVGSHDNGSPTPWFQFTDLYRMSFPLKYGVKWDTTISMSPDAKWISSSHVLGEGVVKLNDTTINKCLSFKEIVTVYSYDAQVGRWDTSKHDTINTYYCEGIGAPVAMITTNSKGTTVKALDIKNSKLPGQNGSAPGPNNLATLNLQSDFKLYPNPVSNGSDLTIQLSNSLPSEVSIYNLQGSLVFTKEFNNSDRIEITTKSFSVGTYIVSVLQNGNSLKKVFVVE